MVPKEGFEPTHPCGYYALNVARLPFRHFGIPNLRGGLLELHTEPPDVCRLVQYSPPDCGGRSRT